MDYCFEKPPLFAGGPSCAHASFGVIKPARIAATRMAVPVVFAVRLMNCLRSDVPARSSMLVDAKVDFLTRLAGGMGNAESACVVDSVMTAYSRVIRGVRCRCSFRPSVGNTRTVAKGSTCSRSHSWC